MLWGEAQTPTGSVGLIHLESHFTDEKAGRLRAETYHRLRRHWQLQNELKLFDDTHHDMKPFGVNVYGERRRPNFIQSVALSHPDTVVRSLEHDGSGTEPGLKDPDGHWDLRPHASRIQQVDLDVLGTWHAVLEPRGVPIDQSRMVYTVNRSTAAVLSKLSAAPRMGSLALQFSRGWDESIDRKKGYFDSEWGVPESWDSVILQGPHLYVATPLYKTPNASMLHNQDWSATDFEALDDDAIPATSYKPIGDQGRYDSSYTHWTDAAGTRVSARRCYRVAYRAMAANKNERTLIAAIIPPGTSHINGVFSFGAPGMAAQTLALVAASAGSLIADFAVRAAPKSGIYQGVFERLPFARASELRSAILLRILRLNCVTVAFESLWSECFDPSFTKDDWTGPPTSAARPRLGEVEGSWTRQTPLRIAADRRQALLETDALVALSLGITAEELCTIYRTQFPVLYGYDQNSNVYDANGRLVPGSVLSVWRRTGASTPAAQRTATHPGSSVSYTYELPFTILDREADMRRAYAEFQARSTRRSNSE